jgi:hypothetical protein
VGDRPVFVVLGGSSGWEHDVARVGTSWEAQWSMRTTALALVVDGVVSDLIEELVFARTPRLLNLSSQPVRVWAL